MTTKDSPLEFDGEGRAIPMEGAETLLLDKVKIGKYAEVQGGPDPDQDDGWQDSHTVRGEFLRHLCLHPKLYKIDPRGVSLIGARIFGPLDLSAVDLQRPLQLFKSRFTHAPILGDATTRTLALHTCHLPGLDADRLTVTGILCLDASIFNGEVCLSGAHITGDLDCSNATLNNPDGDALNADGNALNADGLTTDGSVFLSSITARGKTRLVGADITGDLDCQGATFDNLGGVAFSAERMHVHGRLVWCRFATPPRGQVNFTHAQVGDFYDDGKGWPEAGQLYLDGFSYENLGGMATAQKHCDWLTRMPDTLDGTIDGKPAFWPQPYEQLVKVLRAAGHEHDARKVAIAKQDVYRAHLRTRAMRNKKGIYIANEGHFLLRLWLAFAKHSVGYGYRPWRALIWIALIIAIGGGVFGYANQEKYMHVAKERVYMDQGYKTDKTLPPEYPPFNALVYSIDAMIPFVDLHQENYWEPKAGGFGGGALRLYFWLHIASGWLLATIAAAGLAGVIKKD